MVGAQDRAIAASLKVLEGAWSEVRASPYIQRDLGLPIDRLPDISEEGAIARSARARRLLGMADEIDPDLLPEELATSVGAARFALERMAREGDWYWLVFDPMGAGFFALFAPTSYAGGFLLKLVGGMVAQHRFATAGDVDRYHGLVEDYARLIDQMRVRTEGQAQRGIRMPRLQLDQAIELVGRLAGAAEQTLLPPASRLEAFGADTVLERIRERIAGTVAPAFARLAATLQDSDCRAAAPDDVGMAQYPRGAEIYAELVRLHTTLDLTPAQVHEEGLRRIAEIRAGMEALLRRIGFSGSPEDYLRSIERNPEWRAEGEEALSAVFNRYIERIAPQLDSAFRFKPKAAHGVEALPSAFASSMTFGYYDAPSPDNPVGRYLFNADNLAGNALANIAALNYHELVPGHHFHLAAQRENEALHPVRANSFVNAFNEGWAEYAATLAGEMGMYREPEEQFGRLMMDSFLTCRLVVDTGMNALGWSLEQAREYLRANAFMPETEIQSETLRYSSDIPAQALAYKLGEHFLVDRREEMRAALGERFDIRDFHDAVLMPGALPLPMVGEKVARVTAALSEGTR
ncbi:MAG TPA: DUF885 domain-containing protein [Allosphingosinicella sp.]|nr:DUF885 domain-containing protein [Allosphingosinicella sp.]